MRPTLACSSCRVPFSQDGGRTVHSNLMTSTGQPSAASWIWSASSSPNAPERSLFSAALVLSKASITRAVAPLKAPVRSTPRHSSREAAPRMRQGGGKTALVMSIVMMAVGAGATYYLVKEMQKTTDPDRENQ